eukprot:15366733-Ditylum_brightwellii.AAC.1
MALMCTPDSLGSYSERTAIKWSEQGEIGSPSKSSIDSRKGELTAGGCASTTAADAVSGAVSGAGGGTLFSGGGGTFPGGGGVSTAWFVTEPSCRWGKSGGNARAWRRHRSSCGNWGTCRGYGGAKAMAGGMAGWGGRGCDMTTRIEGESPIRGGNRLTGCIGWPVWKVSAAQGRNTCAVLTMGGAGCKRGVGGCGRAEAGVVGELEPKNCVVIGGSCRTITVGAVADCDDWR